MSQDNTKIGTTSTTSTDATVTPSATTEEKPKDDILSSISLRPGGSFFGAKKPIQPSRYDDTPTTSTTPVTPQTNNNNNNNKQNKQYNNNKNDNQWKDQDNKQNKNKDGGRYNEGMNMGMGMGMGNPQKQEERPETFGGEPFSSKSYPEKKIYDRVFMKKLQLPNNSVPNELDSAFQEFPELKNSNKYQDRSDRGDRDRSYTSPKQEGQGQGQGQGQNRVPNKFAKQPFNNQGQQNQNQYQNNQYQNNQYQNNQYQNNQYQKNNQSKGGDSGQKGLARRAENPWAPRPSFLKDEKDQVLRDIKGVLNKITPDKFTKLTQKIKNYFEKIPDDEIFAEAISLVFAKAVSEPNFSKLYAELCTSLNSSNLPFTKDPTAFRRALLNRCQEQFERVSRKLEDLPEDPEERLLAKEKERKNKVGNVKFIGELFKFNLLGEKIIHGCIKVLFNGIYKFETEGDKESLEMNAELLCKLISTIGGMIDHEKAKGYMDTYCQHIKKFTQDDKLSPRIRFMFQAVLELRENNWKPRREENAPMKIREVHDEAKRKAIEDELFLGEPEPTKPASQSILQQNKDKDKDTKGTPTTSTLVDAKSKAKKKKKPTDKNVKSSSDSIDDDIEQQLSTILSEYLSSGDVKEAAAGLKDLTKSNQASYTNSKFVEYGVIYALEKHEKEREQTSKLFISLFNENVLTQDNFVKGFKTVLETLPDLIVDIPFADKMIGKFIGEAVQGKCINISYFEGINEKVKSSLMEVVNKK